MRRLTLALVYAGLATSPALAQGGRPSSWTLSCERAQALVAQSGSVVMNFSPTTYDRVVSDLRFCLHGEVLIPAYAPTRDNPQCLVGYTCREGDTRRRR